MKYLIILPIFMAVFSKQAASDAQKIIMQTETELGTMQVAAVIDPKKSIVHYKNADSDGWYQYINQENVMSIRAAGKSYTLASKQKPDLTVTVEEYGSDQKMQLRSLNSYFKGGDSHAEFLSDILIQLTESNGRDMTGTVSFYHEGQYKTYPLASIVSQ